MPQPSSVSPDMSLNNMFSNFSDATAEAWLRSRFGSFDTSQQRSLPVDTTRNEKEYFRQARLLGFIKKLPESQEEARNRPLLVAAVEMKRELNERSSRLIQFNFAKKVLQEAIRNGQYKLDGYPTQGLFFFYDRDQFFRFSLVSGEMVGRSFKSGDAKRQSFYIAPEKNNNTAKKRLLGKLNSFKAVKEAFSVETLTKEFYALLFKWYEWAGENAVGMTFPNDLADDKDDRVQLNEAIIRLITRLMFTWFVRQRDIVPQELFTEDGVKSLLTDFDPYSMEQDNYYRCILQNLFFATFNCRPDGRDFTRPGLHGCSKGYSIKTLYHYQKEIKDPQAFMALMAGIPFLNCALFDCLDKKEREEDGGRDLLYDGFSNTKNRQAHVPNGLFFDRDRGLIPLFRSFDFTIDENDADDTDVALDPELLGKVFENLLGAFNPETQETARNATGSFYTPREIVDYMVESSLRHYLQARVPGLTDEELKDLFDREKAVGGSPLPFGQEKAQQIQDALYTCKILDPACGSGAFPMGILHRMVWLFRRLDPKNIHLRMRLLQKMQEDGTPSLYPDETPEAHKEALAVRLREEQLYPDYARKLYLIENCIYGCDVQPIATQIAKLRFFIALLCDQLRSNFNKTAENCGLLPLPNLEAKFVCADTLTALPEASHSMASLLETQGIAELRRQLQENRHKIFRARRADQKEKLKERDAELRHALHDAVYAALSKPDQTVIQEQKDRLASLRRQRETVAQPRMVRQRKPTQGMLIGTPSPDQGWLEIDQNQAERNALDREINDAQAIIAREEAKADPARQNQVNRQALLVSQWDPYDQNTSSEFFDPSWMFNLPREGFDIIIGNPPYIQLQSEGGMYGRKYGDHGFATFDAGADMYCLFTERGLQLLRPDGVLTYVMPNKWMIVKYGAKLRTYLGQYRLLDMLNFGDVQFFDNATNYICILCCQKAAPAATCNVLSVNRTSYNGLFRTSIADNLWVSPIENFTPKKWTVLPKGDAQVLQRMTHEKNTLKDLPIVIQYGIKTGYNKAFYIDEGTKQRLEEEDPASADLIVPMLRGRDIRAFYSGNSGLYMINTHNGVRSKGIEPVNINDYPAIKNYLDLYKKYLSRRGDKGKTLYNLRNCAYLLDFYKPKIFYPNMTSVFPFCYDDTTTFSNDKSFFITADDINLLKYLTGIFNSRLTKLWIWYNCPELQGGTREIRKVYFENIPVPLVDSKRQKPVIDLVETIIALKKQDDAADISAQEQALNQLVYDLYGLTEEEKALAEKRVLEEPAPPKPQRRRKAKKPEPVEADDDEYLE